MRQPPTGRSSKPGFAVWLAFVLLSLGSPAASGQSPVVLPPADAPKAEAKAASQSKATPATPTKAVKKASTGRSKPEDDEPIVMSAEAMAKARGRSLDKDRYNSGPDWATIPAWRQTSFFGIKAEGKLFVYVVDCSGSMIDDDRLGRAKNELRKTINSLQSPQRFKVIFYNDQPVPMPGELPKPADYPSKAQLSRWLHLVEPEGPTDPRSSLSMALAMKPDAVFLLSDGAFPEGTTEAVVRLNPKKVPIHCIDLANGAAGDDLRKIATDSGGQYAARGK